MRLLISQALDTSIIDHIQQQSPALEFDVWEGPGAMSREELYQRIGAVDFMLSTLRDRIDQAFLAHAAKLKVVANIAVGYDNFDLAAMSCHQVLATNTPDVLTDATADVTMGLMINAMRGLSRAEAAMRQGQWQGWSPTGFLGSDLSGKTLGIIGLGRIGSAVARRARAFGMEVVALARPGHTRAGEVPQVPQTQLLEVSDVVSFHVPATPETFHWCDRQFLSQMKKGSYLINTARGTVVDSQALVEALRSGHLAGAGLDVFETEPLPLDHPFWELPTLVMTPHIGSAAVQTRRRMALRAWDNIRQYLTGQLPEDTLNPEIWPQLSK